MNDLGEQHRGRRARLALRLEPQQHQRGQRGDHVEAAVDRVGHAAVAIPGGIAARRDDRAVERVAAPRAAARRAEHALK